MNQNADISVQYDAKLRPKCERLGRKSARNIMLASNTWTVVNAMRNVNNLMYDKE